MSKIYLDACIVIYCVEKHPIYSSKIEALFDELDPGDLLCVSPLVRMECLVMPLRTNDEPLIANFEAFLGAQEMLGIRADIFEHATRIRAEYPSLKTPDALHVATARHYGCNELWTNDDRLARVAAGLNRNVVVG